MHSAAERIIAIPNQEAAPVSMIGAKAHSLQHMAQCGFRVPPALVLPAAFFEPWIATLLATPLWRTIQEAQPPQWPPLCAQLKQLALPLPLNAGQAEALAALAAGLPALGPSALYAVRSSSPDEDSGDASFAGVYETRLGVAGGQLEETVRGCFAALFDHRVLAYKRARNMALDDSALALIVQQQIDSDVAGVAFSINPVNNDYDEAAIDANWGLGESVVSGSVSSDHYVVDKASGALRERRLGAKQLSLSLAAAGGTQGAAHPRQAEFCLSQAQLSELTSVVCQLEALYGHPVDVEWAYACGQLYILQARPVTAWVPLPPEMISAPGAPRTLYMDIALSKGLTMNAPLSPAGADWLADGIAQLARHCFGDVQFNLHNPGGMMFFAGGRMYLNLSNLLCFATPQQLAKGDAKTDTLMAATLAGVDRAHYRAARRPPWIGPALRLAPALLWRLRRPLWRALRLILAPDSTYRRYAGETAAIESMLCGEPDWSLPFDAFRRRYRDPTFACTIDVVMPTLAVAMGALGLAARLARTSRPDDALLAEQLTRGIDGNLVVEMGMAMFRLAKMIGKDGFADLEQLAARIERGDMTPAFMTAWNDFLRRYGCRGPGEMDLASIHYGDDSVLLLRQMSFMAAGDFDPEAAHQLLARQRAAAFETLMGRSGWLRRAALRRVNTIITLFAGTRDTPKHFNLLYQRLMRKRLLMEGSTLVQAGRLDYPDQVFGLSSADLAEAAQDSILDLRARARQRSSFGTLLRRHTRTFPAVIDSRGRILRAPQRPQGPGELAGTAVSPGVVRGPVKILRNAHEKTVEPGDILVAFTTDPGWTPLFINAAAVVLEIGGVLQHGAVVAREYGKPCVVGVADVLTRLHDGQLVEVDGGAGVVRLLPGPGPA